MFTLGTLRNSSAPQQNINSCSYCIGANFETEQKPIRYSVNIALVRNVSEKRFIDMEQSLLSMIFLLPSRFVYKSSHITMNTPFITFVL